jgi:hypothetical protein
VTEPKPRSSAGSSERYGTLGAMIALLALASFIGSFVIPLPGRPEPGHEHDLTLQLLSSSRPLLFYGSGVLLLAAIAIWVFGRHRG